MEPITTSLLLNVIKKPAVIVGIAGVIAFSVMYSMYYFRGVEIINLKLDNSKLQLQIKELQLSIEKQNSAIELLQTESNRQKQNLNIAIKAAENLQEVTKKVLNKIQQAEFTSLKGSLLEGVND